MLALDKVSKVYPNGVHALERFSAEINPGEIIAIIGGSGCGKSTLLRAIAGLDRASSGTVTLDGAVITAPHAKIGIIFQEPRLLPWLSVADNIGYGLKIRGVPSRLSTQISPPCACTAALHKARPTPAAFFLGTWVSFPTTRQAPANMVGHWLTSIPGPRSATARSRPPTWCWPGIPTIGTGSPTAPGSR